MICSEEAVISSVRFAYSRSSLQAGFDVLSGSTLYLAKPFQTRSAGIPATGGEENLGLCMNAKRFDKAWKPRNEDSFDGGCLAMSRLKVSDVRALARNTHSRLSSSSYTFFPCTRSGPE